MERALREKPAPTFLRAARQPFFEGTLAVVAGFAHIFIDNPPIALKAFRWLSPALLGGGLSAGRIAVAAANFLSILARAACGWRAGGLSAHVSRNQDN
jgi:hypothetical protein